MRDDWVDEAAKGYQSDFDILIVVNHKGLADIAEHWYVAEDKIQRDAAIARPVNIIVHTLDEVNEGLLRGDYFWVDIAHDGIGLYELPGSTLVAPRPLTPADAYEMAKKHLGQQLPAIDRWLKLAAVSGAESRSDSEWAKNAAFNLHQAAETAYTCFLLVRSHYVPRPPITVPPGARYIGTVPAGTAFNRMPDGTMIFTHPDHPTKWVNPATMQIENLPIPAGITSVEITIGVDQGKPES